MKKIVVLAGIAAAAIGAMKLLRGGKYEDITFDAEPRYEPQPQPQPEI
jgi:hypothetical protein